MNTLLIIAVFLSIGMGGVGCIRGRERLVRWMGCAVCGLLAVYTLGQFSWEDAMGSKASGGKATRLVKKAEEQMAAKDYDAAIATCADLQPLSPAKAHAIRGEAFERKGQVALARLEYVASYANGNHVASASVARLDKKGG